MKRIFAIFAVLCLLLLPCQAFAAEETAPEAPKLIVTGVAVPGGELAAGESAGITVTIKKYEPQQRRNGHTHSPQRRSGRHNQIRLGLYP